jgi:hypothetical protein
MAAGKAAALKAIELDDTFADVHAQLAAPTTENGIGTGQSGRCCGRSISIPIFRLGTSCARSCSC